MLVDAFWIFRSRSSFLVFLSNDSLRYKEFFSAVISFDVTFSSTIFCSIDLSGQPHPCREFINY